MPYYEFNGENTPRGRNLRTGLDNLRDGLYKLTREMKDMEQMTATQIVANYGVAADSENSQTAAQQAAGLKAELTSDIGKLLTDASQTNVSSALNQLFAQTG